MRRTAVFAIMVFAALATFAASFWDGSAIMGVYGEFPASGAYAACNSFPKNTLIEVKNLENGKTAQAIVTKTVDNPGVFVSLSPEAASSLGISPGQMYRVRVTIPTNPKDPLTHLETDYDSSDPDLNPAILAQTMLARKNEAPQASATQAVAEKPATNAKPEATQPSIASKPAEAAVSGIGHEPEAQAETVAAPEAVQPKPEPKPDAPPEALVAVSPPRKQKLTGVTLSTPDYGKVSAVADPSLGRAAPGKVESLGKVAMAVPPHPETGSEKPSMTPMPDPILDFTMYAASKGTVKTPAEDRPEANTRPDVARASLAVSLALAEPFARDPESASMAAAEAADAHDISRATKFGAETSATLADPELKPDELPTETLALILKAPQTPVAPLLADCELEMENAKPEDVAVKDAPESDYRAVLVEPTVGEAETAEASPERLAGIKAAFDSMLAPPELEPLAEAEASGERLVIGESAVDAELVAPEAVTGTEVADAGAEVPATPAVPDAKVNPEFPASEENVITLEKTDVKAPPANVDDRKLPEAKPEKKLDPAVPVKNEVKSEPKKDPVPARPETAPRQGVAKVERLERGKSYIQLGAFSSVDALNRASAAVVSGVELSYEVAVVKGKTLYRLYAAPLKRDELGVLLLRLKSLGFKDAFVKKEG